MREPGYYWCKDDKEWVILFWNGSYWLDCLLGLGFRLIDSDLNEIDERRIERPPTKAEMEENDRQLFQAAEAIKNLK